MENFPKIKNFENKMTDEVALNSFKNIEEEAEFFNKLDYLITKKAAVVERKIESDGRVLEISVKDGDGKVMYYENLDEISKTSQEARDIAKKLIDINNKRKYN